MDEDAQIYRSAQPDEESFPELKRVGIRSVLNLRQGFKDSVKYKEAFDGIREYECGVNAGMMKQADLVRALKIIKEAPRPLLIHCLHGSDRTGTVVAAYRIVFQGWTPEQAVTGNGASPLRHAQVFLSEPFHVDQACRLGENQAGSAWFLPDAGKDGKMISVQ